MIMTDVILEDNVLEKDEFLVLIDKMGEYAQKQGLTQEILNEILNEEIEY